jgi:hypothetical protein
MPKATELECEVAKRIFDAFDGPHGGTLKFAERRLNAAFLRSNEEDAIVDVAGGLESLLANEKTQEIRYRLRLRLATLARVWAPPGLSALQVYHALGKLYDFRSSVVHGSGDKPAKTRVITLSAEETIPTIALGIRLLRYAVEVLAIHPEYLDLAKLDEFIVTHGGAPLQAEEEPTHE